MNFINLVSEPSMFLQRFWRPESSPVTLSVWYFQWGDLHVAIQRQLEANDEMGTAFGCRDNSESQHWSWVISNRTRTNTHNEHVLSRSQNELHVEAKQEIEESISLARLTSREEDARKICGRSGISEYSRLYTCMDIANHSVTRWWVPRYYLVCSGSVVVTVYDFESGRPGSNPERGLIFYKASITIHRAYSSLHPSGVVHWVPEQLNIKDVTGHARWLMVSAWKAVFGRTCWHIYYTSYEINSTACSASLTGLMSYR